MMPAFGCECEDAMLCPACKFVFVRSIACPRCGEVALISIESLADGVVEAVQERIIEGMLT